MASPDQHGVAGDGTVPGSGMLDLSDAELIENTRSGSTAALEELWHRHSVFGIVAASGTVGSQTDDVTGDVWHQILNDIQTSNTPPGAFRPYLYSTVRQAVAPDEPLPAQAQTMGQAFAALPPTSQEMLWYLDVERMSPEDASLLTGIAAEDIPALQTEARHTLTESWLQASSSGADPTCQMVREYGPQYIQQALPEEDAAVIDDHISSCADCQSVFTTAASMGSLAPGLLLTAVAGTAGSAALATYLANNGPIVINNDPLPSRITDGFATTARTEPEHSRRLKVAIWIAALIVVGLIGSLIAISRIDRQPGNDADGQATTPLQTMTTEFTPSPDLPSDTASDEPTPTPSDTPSDTDTPSAATSTTSTTATHGTSSTKANPPAQQPAPQPAPPPVPQAAQISSINSGTWGAFYPVIAGTAEPGDTITVQVDSTTYRTAAGANGAWQVTPVVGPGSHTVTVKANDNPAPATSSFTVASPPSLSASASSSGITVSLHGIPGAPVQITFASGNTQLVTLDGSGSYSGTFAQAAGSYSVSARYYQSGRYGPSSGSAAVTVSAASNSDDNNSGSGSGHGHR